MVIPPSTGNPFNCFYIVVCRYDHPLPTRNSNTSQISHAEIQPKHKRLDNMSCVFCCNKMWFFIAQDTPSNLMWFPSPQATIPRQQTIKKAMMCMRHLSSLESPNKNHFKNTPVFDVFCMWNDYCKVSNSFITVYIFVANSHSLICYTLHLPVRILATCVLCESPRL